MILSSVWSFLSNHFLWCKTNYGSDVLLTLKNASAFVFGADTDVLVFGADAEAWMRMCSDMDASNGSLVSEQYHKCCTYWSMRSLAVLSNQAKSMDCFYRFKQWLFEVGRWKCYWNHQKAQNHLVWNQNRREYSWVFHSSHIKPDLIVRDCFLWGRGMGRRGEGFRGSMEAFAIFILSGLEKFKLKKLLIRRSKEEGSAVYTFFYDSTGFCVWRMGGERGGKGIFGWWRRGSSPYAPVTHFPTQMHDCAILIYGRCFWPFLFQRVLYTLTSPWTALPWNANAQYSDQTHFSATVQGRD